MSQLAPSSSSRSSRRVMIETPERLIVTIDGPAGTGKSSVSRQLAARLGLEFLDTGAMYRAAAALAIDSGIDTSDLETNVVEIARAIEQANLHFDFAQDPPELLAPGKSIVHRLRDSDVVALVSPISGLREVRRILVELQQRIAKSHPRLVTEGRDQGSVVFPDACVKIYLDASIDVRAHRRADQLGREGRPGDLEAIRIEIAQRDQRDTSRLIGPLVCSEDAIRVDTSDLAQEMVVERLTESVIERIGDPAGKR